MEMSLQEKPLAKAHALFFKGLKSMAGDESKMNVVFGKLQISFFVGGAVAAKGTVISAICTELSEALFEAIVKSSLHLSRWFRLGTDQVDTWQLISVNVNRQRSSDISVIEEKLFSWSCSRARARSCHFLQARDKVLGCPQPGTAWICVLWEQSGVRNVVGVRSVLHNWEIMEV